jgi:hypothetical protein
MAGLAILLQGEERHRQSRQRRLSGNSSNTTSCHSTQRKDRRSIYGEQCRGTLLQVLVRLLRYIFVSRRQKGCRDKGGFFLVNDLQLETGGLPFGLHLDSAATRRTCQGLPLWLHSPMHQGVIDKHPVWLQHAGTRAFINRPRTFYPSMAFLPGTSPFRWKGTTKANRLSPANRSA